jgi:para-nitrobenzyl esterase
LLERYFLVQSAIMFGSGSVELAEIRERAGAAPTYLYQLGWRSPIQDGRLGAAHGMCAPLSMDNAACAPYSDHPGGHAVAAMMSESWLAFARGGNPNHIAVPQWPPYTTAERAVMVFDEVPEVVVDPDPELRLALEGTDFHLV